MNETAHLYPDDEEPYDKRDENYASSEDDESFYCEICDREFPTEKSLSEHKIEHKVCGIDGCTFSAHPLLIQKHITMQHSTGLYHKIKNVSTPEDIQKWITERKKRYPTKTNIELRKAEELEKVNRGEIIKEKQDVTKRKKKKLPRSQNRKRVTKKSSTETLNDTVQQKEVYRGVRKFPGILNLEKAILEDEHQCSVETFESEQEKIVDHISDEEDIPVVSLPAPVIPTPFIPNLVANYGSDSEESDGPEEVPIKRIKIDDNIKPQENDSKKEEVTITKEVTTNNTYSDTNVGQSSGQQQSTDSMPASTNSKRKKKQDDKLQRQSKERSQNQIVRKVQSYRSELLEKLLSRSVQHERNLICQCVKYIVDNNFFDS